MKRLLALSLCLILLCGCGTDTPPPEGTDTPTSATTSTESSTQDPTRSESETQSQPITGSLLSVPLEVTAWDSGRANETSGNNVWETEMGLYFACNQFLYYADKADLTLWVPLCTKPDCKHSATTRDCDALLFSEMLLKGDRIYYNTDKSYAEGLVANDLRGEFVASMALDGTDRKIEYYIPEIEDAITDHAQGSRSVLASTYFVYSLSALNDDGLYHTYVYIADTDGVYKLVEGQQEINMIGSSSLWQDGIYGDEGFNTSFIGDGEYYACRFADHQLTSVSLENLPRSGSYLSGNTLRIFRTGEGYFDVDLTTREETKLSDAQMENSLAHIMLPNCILESALLGHESVALREDMDEHAMKLFNGEVWLDVALPEELVHAADTVVLIPAAVISDRIIFKCQDTAGAFWDEPTPLYQILLGTDNPTLEYLGTLG